MIALAGFAMMFAAYAFREPDDHRSAWASGLVIISDEAKAEKGLTEGAIATRARLLTSSDVAELLLFATGDLAPARALGVKGQVRAKLIEVPLATAGIGAIELQSGRLPEPGRNEILAGAWIGQREPLSVGGKFLEVVGVLKPGLALFADSYLIPLDKSNDVFFPEAVPSVLHAWLVRGSAEEIRDARSRKNLEETFPAKKFGWVAAPDRLGRRISYGYLAGLAIFLLGGSGAIITVFRSLADSVNSPAISAPLVEMKARPRLVWGIHLVYFGLVIAGSLLVFAAPEVQVVLMGKVRQALANRDNPLGLAAEAYQSGNIPLAAALTFAVNFFLGSLAVITLPSCLLPGVGALLAAFRALTWGLLFAPTTREITYGMLPHSLTMLLEGEGYILAAFFGLLIPVQIARRGSGMSFSGRFGRVLLLNIQAQFWIVVVLAVAAIYEAAEVILLNR
jgi:hypothetical protein